MTHTNTEDDPMQPEPENEPMDDNPESGSVQADDDRSLEVFPGRLVP